MLSLMEPALAYVELKAEQLFGTEKALGAALTDVDAKGASAGTIEAAARDAVGVSAASRGERIR